MDDVTFSFLLTTTGQALLAQVQTTYDGTNALAVASRLRVTHDPAQVAAAVTLIELRRRGRTKFGTDADRMYFTVEGLEQATHRAVADHRAHRVVASLSDQGSGTSAVLDLGCGIGSDLIAFARAGLDVVGVDRDPATAAVAAANLQALDLPGRVRAGDATQVARAGFDVTFADPARRTRTGRTFDPRAYSPPWSFVAELLAGRAVVKVAPGIPHALVPSGVEAEWVSFSGALKEAALWSGLDQPARQRATVLDIAGAAATITDQDVPSSVPVAAPGRYVYEPDDAVTRAHLVTGVAAEVNGWLLEEHLAYVSSNHRAATRFARGYEVLDVLPYREKQLKAALRQRDIGAVTIKKRGVQVAPEALRRRLALRGSHQATLMLTRTPTTAVALLVEPLD